MKQRLRTKRASLKSTLFLIALLALGTQSCVKLPRKYLVSSKESVSIRSDDGGRRMVLINLNLASRKQLEQLPGIGQGLAARIIAHREQYGRFRRPEHLMMVRGISDQRFRAMLRFLTVE